MLLSFRGDPHWSLALANGGFLFHTFMLLNLPQQNGGFSD